MLEITCHGSYIILFQAIPGPGKYDIKGIFDPEPPKVNTEGVEVEHPPFMLYFLIAGYSRSW